jgi:hypothetical protein
MTTQAPVLFSLDYDEADFSLVMMSTNFVESGCVLAMRDRGLRLCFCFCLLLDVLVFATIIY